MKSLIALIAWGLIQLVTGDTTIHMESLHGEPVCLKVGKKLICNKKNIDGLQVDQQAKYSPSDQISLDYRPDCREKSVKICVLENVVFKSPDVYYYEDGCFSSISRTSGAEGIPYLADANNVRLCLSNQIDSGSCQTYKLDTNPFWSSTIPSTTITSCDGQYTNKPADEEGFIPSTKENLEAFLPISSQPDDNSASIQPVKETEEGDNDNTANPDLFENTKRSFRKYFSA